MPLIRIAPKVGKSAPTGPLPPQHPHPQPQRPGSEPAPEQLATQGQDRQDQDQDAEGQDAEGQDAEGQGKEQKVATEAKESANQEDADFLGRFLPFGVGEKAGGPEPRDLSLEAAETDPGEGDGPGAGGEGGSSGNVNQVTVDYATAGNDEEITGPMGQPINETETPKVKAKGQPVTAEDTDSERASFAGQELGRRSG